MSLLKRIERKLSFQTTKRKLIFVSAVSRIIIFLRSLVGKDNEVKAVKRMGLRWDLDLHEAIDCCLYAFNNYEPELINHMRKNIPSGSIILDIGANFGVHSLVLADSIKNSTIYAIEGTDFAFEKLSKNIKLNSHLNNILPEQIYLSSEEKNTAISVSASWNVKFIQDKKRNKLDGGFAKDITNAQWLSLDKWIDLKNLDRVDFIKLDVDGNELDVLMSAQLTIKRFAPLIYIELSPIHFEKNPLVFDEMITLLVGHGYKLKDMFGVELSLDPKKLRKSIPYGSLMNALAYK